MVMADAYKCKNLQYVEIYCTNKLSCLKGLTLNHLTGLVMKTMYAYNHVLSFWCCTVLQYFTGLECGHKFCMQCWGDYLTTKIIEEGMGQVCCFFFFFL